MRKGYVEILYFFFWGGGQTWTLGGRLVGGHSLIFVLKVLFLSLHHDRDVLWSSQKESRKVGDGSLSTLSGCRIDSRTSPSAPPTNSPTPVISSFLPDGSVCLIYFVPRTPIQAVALSSEPRRVRARRVHAASWQWSHEKKIDRRMPWTREQVSEKRDTDRARRHAAVGRQFFIDSSSRERAWYWSQYASPPAKGGRESGQQPSSTDQKNAFNRSDGFIRGDKHATY